MEKSVVLTNRTWFESAMGQEMLQELMGEICTEGHFSIPSLTLIGTLKDLDRLSYGKHIQVISNERNCNAVSDRKNVF